MSSDRGRPGRSGGRGPGIALGRLFGVPLFLAPSWFFVALLIVLVFGPSVSQVVPPPGAYLVALAYAVLLLGSVLVHELAHALVSRSLGAPASRVVLDLWGGHTQFDAEATSPGRSFTVAVVGPLANLAIALLAWWGQRVTDEFGVGHLLLLATALSNGFVAVFNLLPGLPLDGGRLLEALVWKVTGRRATGTLAAGWVGRVVAVALVGWALVLPLANGTRPSLTTVVWTALVGAFLWQGATGAVQLGRLRRRAPALDIRSLARPAVGVPDSASIQQAIDAAISAGAQDVLLLSDGRPVAVLDAAAVGAVPVDRRPDVPSHSAARALSAGAAVRSDLPGEDLLRTLMEAPAAEYAVVDGGGRVVGLLVGQDVVAAVTARR